MGHIDHRWSSIRRGRGPLPPLVEGLEFFGDLSSSRTSIVSGAVATLGDSSGNARDFTQATSTKRPAYSSSDFNFGGRPSMTFDGVDDLLVASAFAIPGNVATVYVVFRTGASVTPEMRILAQRTGANANALLVRILLSKWEGSFSNPANTITTKSSGVTLATTTTYRGVAGFDATNGPAAVPTMYVNGSSTGSYALTNASNGGPLVSAAWGLGSNDSGANPFVGSATDFLIYSKSHSAAEVTAIDDWLKWRNGL